MFRLLKASIPWRQLEVLLVTETLVHSNRGLLFAELVMPL